MVQNPLADNPLWVKIWVRVVSKGFVGISFELFDPKNKEKVLKSYDFRTFYGCGGRTRTYDLRVMSCKKSNFPWRFKGFSHFFTENPEVINPIKSTQSIA